MLRGGFRGGGATWAGIVRRRCADERESPPTERHESGWDRRAALRG